MPYGPTPDAPVRFSGRLLVVLFLVPVIAVFLWLALPHGVAAVIVLAIIILAVVFGGLGGAMLRNHDLERRPAERHSVPRSRPYSR